MNEEEKLEAAARTASKMEDDNDYQLVEEEEERLRELSKMNKAEFRLQLKKQIFLERKAKQMFEKEGKRNRKRLLFCILVEMCKVEIELANFLCALIDEPLDGGASSSPTMS